MKPVCKPCLSKATPEIPGMSKHLLPKKSLPAPVSNFPNAGRIKGAM